jgi:hypothetical protein
VLGEASNRRHSLPFTHSHRQRWPVMAVGCGDEQISWPTAERTAPGLACVIPVGYSVNAGIDGKEKVYGSIP